MSTDPDIAVVISSLSVGGAERVVSLLVDAWSRSERDVTVVTWTPPGRDFQPLPEAVDRIGVGPEENLPTPLGTVVNVARRVRDLRKVLTRLEPQVVVSFITRTNIVAAAACHGTGIPLVVAERNNPFRSRDGLAGPLRRIAYPSTDGLVVQTDRLRPWAEDLTGGVVRAIPNPVVDPGDDRLPDLELPDGPTVLAMGKLSHQKGFNLLLEAFASCVRDGGSPWTLVIGGEGPERGRLRRRARELGIADEVSLPGTLEDPAAFLRQGDLFVLSSRFEGFPNALLEAMACGLPVISFDCEFGPREIIRNGTDGVLVPPEDVDQLSAAMRELMKDEKARKRLGRNATEVLDRFALDEVAQRWIDLFDEVT